MAMTMKMIVRSKGWRKAVEMTVGKKTGGRDEGEMPDVLWNVSSRDDEWSE